MFFCQLNFIVLFPFLIKYYHILFIIIVFWLGCDRTSFFPARFASFHTNASLLVFFVCFFILFHFSRCQVREKGGGRVKPPESLNIGVFNVRGCSTNEAKKGEIGKISLRRRFDVCALRETKLKGKGEVMFGEVVCWVSGVAVGRAREGVELLLNGRVMRCVVEWKEVSSRLMWVRVKIERELGVYIGK